MNIDIAFESGSLDFNKIAKFIGIIEQFKINKIEINIDNNLLKTNPVSNKENKENNRISLKYLKDLLIEIKGLKKSFIVYIYSKEIEFTIYSDKGFGAIGLNDEQLNLFDDFLSFENLLSFTVYNPKDCLLESMKMHIGSLSANNFVHLYPGYKLYISKNIIPQKEEFINQFKPIILGNKFELSFSNNTTDITLKKESSSLLSFLGKNKYQNSLQYASQVNFVNYLLKYQVINQINEEFELLGYIKYKNEFNEKGLLSKSIYYLDENGESTIMKNATYEFEQTYKGGAINESSLKKI